jgi:hypothetical protein
MKPSQMGIALLLAAALAIGLIYFKTSSPSEGVVDGQKIVTATASYARDLKIRGLPVPSAVSLKELIGLRYLKASDVSGLAGLEVTVNLLADPTQPQDVLIRARLPSGEEMVTLVDGTVQQIPAAVPAK